MIQIGTVILSKIGFRVFFQFPIGDLAFFAGTPHPFIADPAGGAAIFGIAHEKGLTAMGSNFGVLPFIGNGTDTVKGPVAGGPKLDLFQKAEKIDVFTKIAFCIVRRHKNQLLPENMKNQRIRFV